MMLAFMVYVCIGWIALFWTPNSYNLGRLCEDKLVSYAMSEPGTTSVKVDVFEIRRLPRTGRRSSTEELSTTSTMKDLKYLNEGGKISKTGSLSFNLLKKKEDGSSESLSGRCRYSVLKRSVDLKFKE